MSLNDWASWSGEAVKPVLVRDYPAKNCRVSVHASSAGATLKFDTPNGEVTFRVTDDEWREIQDAVWLAMDNRGIFDRSNDND